MRMSTEAIASTWLRAQGCCAECRLKTICHPALDPDPSSRAEIVVFRVRTSSPELFGTTEFFAAGLLAFLLALFLFEAFFAAFFADFLADFFAAFFALFLAAFFAVRFAGFLAAAFFAVRFADFLAAAFFFVVVFFRAAISGHPF